MHRLRTICLAALLVAAAATALRGDATVRVHSVDGRVLSPFQPASAANVLFFVATDCPVSNGYAPEIQKVCRDYGSRGVSCTLVYEDIDSPGGGTPLDDQVRRHMTEYRYNAIPAAVDRTRAVAQRAGATITPEAVVVDAGGAIRYRGRIDNFHAALGTTRQQVTERDLRDALDAVLAGRAVARPRTQALGCFIVDPKAIGRK